MRVSLLWRVILVRTFSDAVRPGPSWSGISNFFLVRLRSGQFRPWIPIFPWNKINPIINLIIEFQQNINVRLTLWVDPVQALTVETFETQTLSYERWSYVTLPKERYVTYRMSYFILMVALCRGDLFCGLITGSDWVLDWLITCR